MIIRRLLGLAAMLVFSVAAAGGQPIAGIDYQDLGSAASTPSSGDVEVVEYFWYRCPHCYALEPLLNPWIADLPAGVHFRRIPAVLGKEWLIDARVFYALDAIGELDRLHQKLLYAIHEKGGRRLDRSAYEQWVAEWLRGQGVDMQRYQAAYESAGVQEKVLHAADVSRRLKLEGTPTFEIAGRYIVNPPIGDRRRVLEITNYLVGKIRADPIARR
jgi:protein dithiol oxidoreductase (disulfide-forming)